MMNTYMSAPLSSEVGSPGTKIAGHVQATSSDAESAHFDEAAGARHERSSVCFVTPAACPPTCSPLARKSGGHRPVVSAWSHRRQRAAVEATESGFGGSVNSLSG